MPGPITVDDLLSQVRQQIDESNQDDVTTPDILQALNRGQRRAANTLVKAYEDLFITSTTLTSTGSATFDIPEDAFGRRIDHLTVVHSSSRESKLTRVKYSDLYKYAGTASSGVQIPYVYAIKGREFQVAPTPASGVVLRCWYDKAPETLVQSQGRITSVSVASSYVLVDALSSDTTTSVDALGAFVNIVDAQTGEIKVTLQNNAVTTSTKKIEFKTSGLSLSTVYGRTVATAVPTTVEVNDYVCAVQGTCVPDLPDACLDYLIQYAVVEIRRRLGESVQDELVALGSLEKELERQWAGREQSNRVQNKARYWGRW